MIIKKFSLNNTYSRSDEPKLNTYDLDIELRFDDLLSANNFYQKLANLIDNEINPSPSMNDMLKAVNKE